MSTDQENLKKALDSLSPKCLESAAVRESFRAFFDRGTQNECQQLLPGRYKLSNSPVRRDASAASTASQRALRYFTSKGVPRAKKLVDAVASFETLDSLTDADYETMWDFKDRVLKTQNNDPYTRLRHLLQAIDEFRKERLLSVCALRLGFVFFSHDIDRIGATVPKNELRRGRGRRSIAFDIIEQSCGLEREKLQETSKKSNICLSLVKEGGLGSLLVGSSFAVWENLESKYIPLVFQYIKECLPSIANRLEERSIIAAREIIRGLQSYGWTNYELSEGGSRLMNYVEECVDIKQLANGEIVQRIASPSTSGLGKRPAMGHYGAGYQPNCKRSKVVREAEISPAQTTNNYNSTVAPRILDTNMNPRFLEPSDGEDRTNDTVQCSKDTEAVRKGTPEGGNKTQLGTIIQITLEQDSYLPCGTERPEMRKMTLLSETTEKPITSANDVSSEVWSNHDHLSTRAIDSVQGIGNAEPDHQGEGEVDDASAFHILGSYQTEDHGGSSALSTQMRPPPAQQGSLVVSGHDSAVPQTHVDTPSSQDTRSYGFQTDLVSSLLTLHPIVDDFRSRGSTGNVGDGAMVLGGRGGGIAGESRIILSNYMIPECKDAVQIWESQWTSNIDKSFIVPHQLGAI